VLLELRAEASGPAYVVIGVGLNVRLDGGARERTETSGESRWDYRVAAVADACAVPPSRNFLAGAIIHELLSMLGEFERTGFASFEDAWTALDVLRDRPSRVVTGSTTISGIARGVGTQGSLRLERDGEVLEFVSGEVSLRPVGDDI
jgi:BirA family biotin operon repressor/biotin-[acetyl-CoA-carboxylase] ligase